jgi:hypothetical protein
MEYRRSTRLLSIIVPIGDTKSRIAITAKAVVTIETVHKKYLLREISYS